MRVKHQTQFSAVLAVCALFLAGGFAGVPGLAQETYPAPPADHVLVYVADGKNEAVALPTEAGTTPLRAEALAGSDKTSYVEVAGASAATTLATSTPRFYLFVPDEAGAHPPFIVLLRAKRGARRVTAIAQRGLRGYAIASEEIVKPHYRVLMREGGMLYMEVRPREPLAPGEYAVLGSDLKRVATFRIAPPAG